MSCFRMPQVGECIENGVVASIKDQADWASTSKPLTPREVRMFNLVLRTLPPSNLKLEESIQARLRNKARTLDAVVGGVLKDIRK